MRGLRIVESMASQLWAILPEKLEAMLEVVDLHTQGVKLDAATIQARTAQRKTPRTAGAVAVLPLQGIIAQKMNLMTEISGGTSTEKFAADFRAMIDNPQVGAIVIDVDSPGGSVEGVGELADLIYASRGAKPIIAVANPLMASAAYWIASAADEVVVPPLGQVGSIGALMMHASVVGADEQEGVDWSVVAAGKYKAERNPHVGLSDEARGAMQSEVDQAYGLFVEAVARHRTTTAAAVADGYGEARVLRGDRAVEAGLADRVGTLDSVIEELAGTDAQRTRMAATAAGPKMAAISTEAITAEAGSAGTVVFIDANGSTITGGSEVAPGDVPEVDLINQPAPEAKGDTMPENTNGTAATVDKPGAEREDLLRAERDRTKEIRALAEEHDIDGSTVDAWITSGADVNAVSGEILKQIRDRAAATPGVKVGADREAEKPFQSFGEQLVAIHRAHPQVSNTVDKRLLHLNSLHAAATGMSQGDPSSAGFLVSPQYSQTIWDGITGESDSLLSRVDSYPVEGESLTFNANAETSRATGSRWGGVQSYWIAEADQITSSKPKFRQVKLEPQQLAVLVYLTDKLLNNAPQALEQYTSRAAIDEIGFMTGDAIINGTGAGKPLGLLNSGSIVSVAKESSQAAETIDPNNISKMWSRLHPRARKDAIWLYNVDVEPQFDALNSLVKNVAGSENVGGYAPKVYDAEAGTLKGRPTVPCEYCATLGTVGDLILWSPSGYAAGVRSALQSAMSMHIRFDYAETAFRFIYEVDGQPWLASALTPFKGTNTLTTHVSLATRA